MKPRLSHGFNTIAGLTIASKLCSDKALLEKLELRVIAVTKRALKQQPVFEKDFL
jgi:hypothetical protein